MNDHAQRTSWWVLRWRVFAATALTLGFMGACTGGEQLLTPDPEPLLTAASSSVSPVFVPGNPSCTALGYAIGFKPQPEPPPSGTYTFPDGINTLTITSDGTYFSWSSTLGIDAVIAKGGPNANVYPYDPPAESFGDTNLSSPINPSTGGPYGLSHIEFCYDYELDVSKTAQGTYDERHHWDIEKSVAPTYQEGYAGDLLGWTWTVDVSETSIDENWAVSGTITVFNPSPYNVTFNLTDMVDGGYVATIDCGASPPYVLGAGQTLNCAYATPTADASATSNTASATVVSPAAVKGAVTTVPISWTKTVIDGTATVDDDQEPDFPTSLTAGTGPWQWMESQDHMCSLDASDYDANGEYTATLTNTAIVTGSDGQTDQAYAETTYLCRAGGYFQLQKYTAGQVNAQQDWSFILYENGFGGVQVLSVATSLGDDDGILSFGTASVPTLNPSTTYTVCELGVPAGWTAVWMVGATIVIPYNPNAADTPPADVGNRCFDFGDGTAYPLVPGVALDFTVNNTQDGGEPRTPGYWKNWNTCTNGNQAHTAASNGGVAEGFFLLDDILNSPGIVWGSFAIASCADGVSVLDQRDLVTGRKRASDAAYTLAMHLMAAQLNFAAGAEVCSEATDAAAAAEALLVGIGFDGTGMYLRPRNADYSTALGLAYALDEYNNGHLCSP